MSTHRALLVLSVTTAVLVAPAPAPPVAGQPGGGVTVICPTSPVPGVELSTTEGYAARRPVSATAAAAAVTGIEVAVTPAPPAGSFTIEDLVPAAGPGGTATATLALGAGLPPGTWTATVTASTAAGPTGTCTATVEVVPLVPVGAVQGVVTDDQSSFTSPLLGQRVAVRAVVTQLTLDTGGNRGFFLQEATGASDGDPRSSDGVFVFNSGFTTLRTEAEGPARGQVGPNWTVRVGDEVVLRGTVGQFSGMTQFSGSSAFIWEITATGLAVPETVTVAEVDPPAAGADAVRYFRRQLGMQLAVPAGSVVVGGRDVFAGADAEVWAIRGDHPVAGRADPYARRVFRDPHPLDNQPEPAFDDGNGYRFVLGSLGVKATAGDPAAVLPPARTFDTLTAAATGGVYLSFGKYTINVSTPPVLAPGPDPAANAPVPAPRREREASVAGYNVENLYDFRDSPHSGCDFAGNPGCSGEGGTVAPPFDYVPASDADYQDRLARMAAQVRLDLHAPDVLMVQETEAQDVCRVAPGWAPGAGLGTDRLECDLTGPPGGNSAADGRPDSLQELALIIAEQGGPGYTAAFDPDSGDLRGITTAYLFRTDRVQLLPVAGDHPVLGADPAVDYAGAPLPLVTDVANPKAFNARLPEAVAATCTGSGPTGCDGRDVYTRAPQVALLRIWRAQPGLSTWTDLYLINNHFSSGPQDRVLQRTEQAGYAAALAEAILAAEPDARVLLGGDLNVFPPPDDPYPPGAPIPGVGTGPSDQLGPLVDSPLRDLSGRLLAAHPAAAYSYGFQGQAQTLDHLWASPVLAAGVLAVDSAKINVDWPADAAGERPAYGRFGVSDHDPLVATLSVAASFDSVRALRAHLEDTGALPRGASLAIGALLEVAEVLTGAGRHRAAGVALGAAQRVLEGLATAGVVDPAVAGGLTAEIGQLRR